MKMLKSVCIILFISVLLLMPGITISQSSIRYVTSFTGLTLYSDKSQSSSKIVLIPYHSKVKVLEDSQTVAEIQGKKGKWLKVKFKNKNNTSKFYEGWCFSGFITEEKPDIVFNVPMGAVVGTPLQVDVSYSNSELKKESDGDSISDYYSETISFKPDKTFKYIVFASHPCDSCEGFSDSKDFIGSYKTESSLVSIVISNCDEFNDVLSESQSGRDEKLITILNGGGSCENELLCAETANKYLLINPEGVIYTADKSAVKKK